MDFTRPERCRPQRTGREDRHSKFHEITDNLSLVAACGVLVTGLALNKVGVRLGHPSDYFETLY
jgi:hypothetical protein